MKSFTQNRTPTVDSISGRCIWPVRERKCTCLHPKQLDFKWRTDKMADCFDTDTSELQLNRGRIRTNEALTAQVVVQIRESYLSQ